MAGVFSKCWKCLDSYELQEDETCACSQGYYSYEGRECLKCDLGCAECSYDSQLNSTICEVCVDESSASIVEGVCQCDN